MLFWSLSLSSHSTENFCMLEWWADSETCWPGKNVDKLNFQVALVNTASCKTYARVNDICRELELQLIASACQCFENRRLSIQHKLCKIAWWLCLLVPCMYWITRGTGATQWYLIDKQLILLLLSSISNTSFRLCSSMCMVSPSFSSHLCQWHLRISFTPADYIQGAILAI